MWCTSQQLTVNWTQSHIWTWQADLWLSMSQEYRKPDFWLVPHLGRVLILLSRRNFKITGSWLAFPLVRLLISSYVGRLLIVLFFRFLMKKSNLFISCALRCAQNSLPEHVCMLANCAIWNPLLSLLKQKCSLLLCNSKFYHFIFIFQHSPDVLDSHKSWTAYYTIVLYPINSIIL